MKYLCCCCLPKRKRLFKNALKHSIRKKLDIKVPSTDKAIEKDPYLLVGYGMNAFFETLRQLFTMMLFISFFAVCLMITYSQFSGLEGTKLYLFSQFSMGNLGGSKAICQNTPYTLPGQASSLALSCTSGTINMAATSSDTGSPIFSAGIIPSDSMVTNYCSNSAWDDPNSCSSYIDQAALETEMYSRC